MNRRVLRHTSVLLQTTLPTDAAAEARALRAFVMGHQLPTGTDPLACSLHAVRALEEGNPRKALDVVAGCRKEGRWRALALWIEAHCEIETLRRQDPFARVPATVGEQLESLWGRLQHLTVYWLDRAAACDDPERVDGYLGAALETTPDEPLLCARQAELAERLGEPDRAARLRRGAAGVGINPIVTLAARAAYAEGRGNVARARAVYEELCALPDAPPSVFRRRAQFLLRTGWAKDALPDAERAHEAEGSEQSLALLADALTASGRAEEALVLAAGDGVLLRVAHGRALRSLGRFEEALHETPEWGEAAACHLALGQLDEAEEAAVRARSALGFEVLARIALSQDRAANALSLADRAIRLDPLRAACHAMRGVLVLREDRFREATEAFAKAVEIDPSCWEAWRGIAEMRYQQGHFDEASEALDRIPASVPLDQAFYLLRARLRTKRGFLAEAIHLDSNPFFLLLERAEMKLELQDYAGVRADAELARSKVRRASQPWKLIAMADLAEGKAEDAERAFDEAIRRYPRDAEARLARSTLRRIRKDRAGAREDLAAAVEASPDDVESLWSLLSMDVEDGRWPDVLLEVERFLTLRPDDPRAAQARGWMSAAHEGLERRDPPLERPR